MAELTPSELDANFGIGDYITFHRGDGDFPFAKLKTLHGIAEVCLHGAHVTSWIPTGEAPVIWTSPTAIYKHGKAIRGGIPICWPWFADHPTDPTLPAHGIVRTEMWEVVATSHPDSDTAQITLEFPPPPDRLPFELFLTISLSNSLMLNLSMTNLAESAFTLTDALHTYLNVGSIDAVRIEGLDRIRYHDKMDGYTEKVQSGDVTIGSPCDHVFESARSDILVHDASLARTIRVGKVGSDTTVLWNPWKEGAEKIADMPDDGYRTMVCVEAANAGEEIVRLAPGESHLLGTSISLA